MAADCFDCSLLSASVCVCCVAGNYAEIAYDLDIQAFNCDIPFSSCKACVFEYKCDCDCEHVLCVCLGILAVMCSKLILSINDEISLYSI